LLHSFCSLEDSENAVYASNVWYSLQQQQQQFCSHYTGQPALVDTPVKNWWR